MGYRTRTYIAGDWDTDKDAVDKLYQWNNSNYLNLSFVDAHEFTSARDSSLNCSIKSSLKKRMDISKTFVLIVGKNTNSVTAGSCQYCRNYSGYYGRCLNGYSVDYKSYIQYECKLAVDANLKIIVLYNDYKVDKNKCPEILRYKGVHIPMTYRQDGKEYWDYQGIRKVLD